ncbi:MAG: glycosyltransferase family 2 protein [Deltaproteobacteria bacterium]|jgi:glycosyltransferase involved in cell wall biosynthesis|nr:glycosyltransferase family 2 protein [Deltaproteobacteria bacterium]
MFKFKHHQPYIAILMCTYNGKKFINEQLKSIYNQTVSDWILWVSDDGSKSETIDILKSWQNNLGKERMVILPGPLKGFCQNFLSLTANKDISARFYAWADQDDIWKPEKLHRALTILNQYPLHTQSLYCGRTELINSNGKKLSLSSPLHNKPLNFSNALVQSVASGNTMVFNQTARELIATGYCKNPVAHDWWAYMTVSGTGGTIFYDPEPMVLYRQHDGNIIGEKKGIRSKISRVRNLLCGRFRTWNAANVGALSLIKDKLTENNKEKLAIFSQLSYERNPVNRWRLFRDGGFYRQTTFDNLAMKAAAWAGLL